MKICYVMRGIPGSGKSHTAKTLVAKENIFSTDDFWGPDYDFDIKKIGIAHEWNQTRAARAMSMGDDNVVIDNTNTTWKEVEPYVLAAFKNGYDVVFQEPESPWWEHVRNYIELGEEVSGWSEEKCVEELAKHGTHGVPEFVIKKMLSRWALTDALERKRDEIKLSV